MSNGYPKGQDHSFHGVQVPTTFGRRHMVVSTNAIQRGQHYPPHHMSSYRSNTFAPPIVGPHLAAVGQMVVNGTSFIGRSVSIPDHHGDNSHRGYHPSYISPEKIHSGIDFTRKIVNYANRKVFGNVTRRPALNGETVEVHRAGMNGGYTGGGGQSVTRSNGETTPLTTSVGYTRDHITHVSRLMTSATERTMGLSHSTYTYPNI